MRVRGVMLDIDGTLVASNDAHARAWVKALSESGYSVAFTAVRPLIGMGGDKLLPKVCGVDADSKEGKRISERRGEIFLREFVPQLLPCRGAKELLQKFADHEVKMVVASSAKEGELKALLKICEANQFVESTTSSDDADNSKPDPDILHVALDKLDLPREDVIMLGDTPYDIEAARRAKVRVIALRCGGWNDKDLHADAIFDDPADLAAHFNTTFADAREKPVKHV